MTESEMDNAELSQVPKSQETPFLGPTFGENLFACDGKQQTAELVQ